MNTENNTDARAASRSNRVRPPKPVVRSKLSGGFVSSSKTMARLRERYRNYRPTCSPQSLYILRGNKQVPLPQTISVKQGKPGKPGKPGKLGKSGTSGTDLLSDYIFSNLGQHSERYPDQSEEILLLVHINNIFRAKNVSKLRTKNLIATLCKNKLWATYCNGRCISARRLGTILGEFSIHSKDIRFKAGVFKGLYRETIMEACRRFNVA